MKHRYCLIILVVVIAEINLTKSWRHLIVTDAPRRELTGMEKKKLQNDIKEFLDIVTLNETKKIWKEKNFRYCYNKVTYPYNMALITFRSESLKHLDYYYNRARRVHVYLIKEINEYMNAIADLIGNIKNKIFLETEKKDFELPVKKLMQVHKSKIEEKLILTHKNLLNIKYTIRYGSEMTELQNCKVNLYIN